MIQLDHSHHPAFSSRDSEELPSEMQRKIAAPPVTTIEEEHHEDEDFQEIELFYPLRRVNRTRGANGCCGTTKTPGPTPQTHKGRVTMPHISELYRNPAKKKFVRRG